MNKEQYTPEYINKLLAEKAERVKELTAINRTTTILQESASIDECLGSICRILPDAWQYPDHAVARIVFNNKVYRTENFTETPWMQMQEFETIDNRKGQIEVFYTREFPDEYEGPFLQEERNLISNLAMLITGYLNSVKSKEGKYFTAERLKELAAINLTTKIIKENKSIEDTLQQICLILPKAWQYPDFTAARIRYNHTEFRTPNFRITPWVQSQTFEAIDNTSGSIEIYYLQEFKSMEEGPFLKEERHLINNLAVIIVGYLNGLKAKSVLKSPQEVSREDEIQEKDSKPKANRKLLQKFLNKQNYTRDIFHDLMPFKVNEILLVANLYDAYSIEKEGRFSEHILGEYYQLNLTSMPRVTGVSSQDEVMEQLQSKHYDLIIIMTGNDMSSYINLSYLIKEDFPYIPIFLLLNNNKEIDVYQKNNDFLRNIDKVFVWNGDPKIFFALVKYLEDKVNVENDTSVGLVNVILLVEDSPIYYSRYLPILYTTVLEQTKRIIADVTTDELYKVLRLRARPKILLASTYEDAVEIFNRYREYMLCLITDMKFERNAKPDDYAGIKLVNYVREKLDNIPVIIQSSDIEHANTAYQLKSSFIHKHSESLLQDFKSFITYYLGFGNFIYRDKEGRQIAVAKSLKEFETLLHTIPDESLLYHAKMNHFSLWLMARGEIKIARRISPYRINDFPVTKDIRNFLLDAIQKLRNEQNKGKIIPFEDYAILDESNIVSLSSGSLGGKGRGLGFINTLIYNFEFSNFIPSINIRTPKTAIIGTDEFELFLERNKLYETVRTEQDYEVIRETFINSKLTEGLIKKLKIILKLITKPIAVRSSGLFEDSMMQPFAGIFETYLLPNNHPSQDVRLEQVTNAIKLVYASVYSKMAKGYFEAVNYKIEEEKMAVIIQEVVGNRYEDAFYPHISGVAQSYNYYPYAHMKPDEGFAVIAVGLGRYVVEGEMAYRFSPRYPMVEINSPKDQYKNSQVSFYAVDMEKKDVNLLEGEEAGLIKLETADAERHGNLRHCASVYDVDGSRIIPGITKAGPRIINFANILKYNYIPLAETISTLLDLVQEAMGCPVEIEFAIDLNKDKDFKASFYLLQIKPLIGNTEGYSLNMSMINSDDVLLYTETGMGNGCVNNITDVIYINKSSFDKSKTIEMAEEIDKLNAAMIKEDRKYVLIGPGRWGTRDRWIGIPVNWPQISNAKIIVETSLDDYPLDPSSGSHFFHNVTSMNCGYFSIDHHSQKNYIQWDVLNKQQTINETAFFKHIRFQNPLEIKMDGKKRISVITWKQ